MQPRGGDRRAAGGVGLVETIDAMHRSGTVAPVAATAKHHTWSALGGDVRPSTSSVLAVPSLTTGRPGFRRRASVRGCPGRRVSIL